MAREVTLPGFGYSPARAAAVAAAVLATVKHAQVSDVQVTDVLAGLAQAAGEVILARPLRRDPGKAAAAIADYIVSWVKTAPPA